MRYAFTRDPRSYETDRPAKGVPLSLFDLAEYLRTSTPAQARATKRINSRRAFLTVLGGAAILITNDVLVTHVLHAPLPPYLLFIIWLIWVPFTMRSFIRRDLLMDEMIDAHHGIGEGEGARHPSVLMTVESLLAAGELEVLTHACGNSAVTPAIVEPSHAGPSSARQALET